MKKIIIALVIAFIISYLIFVHTRGFIPYDDGWFIQAGQRMLAGQVPYKDFSFIYNPGGIYLNWLAFKLFGVSVLTSRSVALVNSLVALILLVIIGKHFKISKFALLAILLVYSTWGTGHINFVWPVMLCLTTGLATVYCFSKANAAQRPQRYIFLAGVFCAITFIFKQNFGLAIMLSSMIFFVFQTGTFKNKVRFVSIFLAGYLLVIALQFFYFFQTNSLQAYLSDFYQQTIVNVGQKGLLTTPWPWEFGNSFLLKLGKTLVYFFPALVSIIAILKLVKHNKALIFIPATTLFYFALSIRPTTDYIHLSPLIAFTSLSFLALLAVTRELFRKLFICFVLLFIGLLGLYSSLWHSYYRWNTPLIKQTTFIKAPSFGIVSDQNSQQVVIAVNAFYHQNDTQQTETFVYPYDPLFYLIAQKSNPTSFDCIAPGFLTHHQQQQVVTILEAKKIRLILTNEAPTKNDLISPYIQEHYSVIKTVSNYQLWLRKT